MACRVNGLGAWFEYIVGVHDWSTWLSTWFDYMARENGLRTWLEYMAGVHGLSTWLENMA